MENILIIGAAGQIGSELTMELRRIYGNSRVFATDIKDAPQDIKDSGPFQLLDVMDDKHLIHFVIRNKITQIYHLAAVLSGNAEKLPTQAWHINMSSLMNILEVAKLVEDIKKVFWPSSIAVFGPTTPRINAPQLAPMEPTTVYGISKLAGERWCEYYWKKYGVDVRSLRYPGLISYKTEAGGGTTDWAVEIYYEALRNGKYTCFLEENTKLPMLFMPDAIDATVKLMEIERDRLKLHSGYNIMGECMCPADVTKEIQKHIPDFTVDYKPDFRQQIAETWPESVDDSTARYNDDWKPKFDIASITSTMLKEVGKKIKG
ncbi:MAG: NAD-dependent epimerase/dehydratase family protein [Bacteroidales bacterium]|nr:NAD-dependent epimerase/dehydratase family protein [Bacteroidales bacterium]